MKGKLLAISVLVTLLGAPLCFAASVEKAGMLHQHGLTHEAKSELIDVIFSKSGDSDKAQSYYLLGVECQDIDNDFLCHDIADTLFR